MAFDRDGEKFEVWETRFRDYLSTKELDDLLINTSSDASKNKQVDQPNRPRQGDFGFLRNYYVGASKSRVISLYKKLSTLQLSGDEQLANYIIRAEAVATALKKAGEVVSQSMIMAMVLSGFPPTYDTFSTVVEQREKDITF